jgi:hypothetical protein
MVSMLSMQCHMLDVDAGGPFFGSHQHTELALSTHHHGKGEGILSFANYISHIPVCPCFGYQILPWMHKSAHDMAYMRKYAQLCLRSLYFCTIIPNLEMDHLQSFHGSSAKFH